MTQTNAAGCIISQRKTVSSGGVVVAVIVVWGLSAIISVICERLWGFFVCRLIELVLSIQIQEKRYEADMDWGQSDRLKAFCGHVRAQDRFRVVLLRAELG